MFGNKLRSWMEAVRSRKKQHRKEKQAKCNVLFGHKNTVKWETDTVVHNDYRGSERKEPISNHLVRPENHCQSGSSGVANSRYSANNLSSPESAYSTGYSTDGTSPGAPPDNLLNSTKSAGPCQTRIEVLNPVHGQKFSAKNEIVISSSLLKSTTQIAKETVTPLLKQKGEHEEPKYAQPTARINETLAGSLSPALGLTSPRQRNRIRTNPWVPSGILSPSPVKHEVNKTAVGARAVKDSPRHRFLSPVASRRRSLSSSSCSSLSATSVQLEIPRHRSVSDEDCTLNEMMGKYDESYVYEKETDILSDSDPTDCDTDIDTGQDGGDEDDPYEGELDFIDNCSYLEFESRVDHNTGHCSYYNYDVQRKRSSRRRTQRKSSKSSEKKRRSCSSKKRFAKPVDRETHNNNPFIDGSKSAGATPVSVRRANNRPVSKLALENCLRKRSNSVSSYHDKITTIDKRDKEADMKYRELITEAEQILRSMKTNGLSPRRVPGPANKRVELLRFTECAKPEIFTKNRQTPIKEDTVTTNPFCSKIPSVSGYNCPRFSPKKNHITKFIINNSPVLARKEWEMQSKIFNSPVCSKKSTEETCHLQKTVLHKEKMQESNRISPKHRRKFSRPIADSSSDSDEYFRRRGSRPSGCPQSEPLRRKNYFGNNTHKSSVNGKTVDFNMANETVPRNELTTSTENIRQKVLLNTIANLKKNLEDHSASLKQVYRSSHNIYL